MKDRVAVVGAEPGRALGVVAVDGTAPASHRARLGDPVTYNSTVVD
jgi:hypothetical protein